MVMAEKMFYIPLEWAVWMSDPGLSLCSPAARGIWVDFLCSMQGSGRTGMMTGFRGSLARVTRCSTDELASALNELDMYGVADITEEDGVVTVINRRMRKEHLEREMATKRQQRHREKEPDNPPVTPPVTAPVTPLSPPIVQSSEVKSKDPDKESKPLTEGGAGGRPMRGHRLDVAVLAERVLGDQWTNDAGKWVNRIWEDCDKVRRVMEEVRSAIVEKRVKTTPAQMAENTWGFFK